MKKKMKIVNKNLVEVDFTIEDYAQENKVTLEILNKILYNKNRIRKLETINDELFESLPILR